MSSNGNTGKGSTRGTSYEGRKRVHQSWHIWGLAGDLPVSYLQQNPPPSLPESQDGKREKKTKAERKYWPHREKHAGIAFMGIGGDHARGSLGKRGPSSRISGLRGLGAQPRRGLGFMPGPSPLPTCSCKKDAASLEAAMRSLKCQRALNTGSCCVQIMAYLHTDHTVTSLVAHSPKAEQVSCREEMGTQP